MRSPADRERAARMGPGSTGAGAGDPGPAAWAALRALLRRDRAPEGVDDGALARAALIGGVTRLTLDARPDLTQFLAAEAEARLYWDLALERACAAATVALAGVGIRPLALKGSATAHLVYADPAQRERRDVDLLVRPREFDAAVAALRERGWAPAAQDAWWARARATRYEVPLSRPDDRDGLEVDLHARLTLYDHLPIDHEGLHARGLRMAGVPMAIAAPTDALLHTCLHAATTGFRVPLRAWVDVTRLMADARVDPQVLVARARAWNIAPAVWAGLRVAQRWLDAPVSPRTLAALAPPRPVAAALSWLLSGDGARPLREGPAPAAQRQAVKALALGGARPDRFLAAHGRLRWAAARAGQR